MSVGVDPALALKRKQLLKEAKVFRPQYDTAIEESKRAQIFNAQATVAQLTKSSTMAAVPIPIAPMPAPAQPYNNPVNVAKTPTNKAKIMPDTQRAMSQNTMPMNQFQSQNSGPMFYSQQSMPMQGLNMSGMMQQPMMMQQQPMMAQSMIQQPMQQGYGMQMPYQLLPQNINLQQGTSLVNQRGQILGQAMQGMFQGTQAKNYK